MNILELDHLAVAGTTLAEAQAHVEAALGLPMQPGGQHDVFATHNALMGLDAGLYLEAIAADPSAPPPGRARWFDLDGFAGPPRLRNWICRCEDLDAALARLPAGFGAPVALRRGDLRWRMAVPQDGILPFDNLAPALIEWEGSAHPAQRLAPSGCGLDRLVLRHPQAADLAALLQPLLQDGRIAFEEGPAAMQVELRLGNTLRVLR